MRAKLSAQDGHNRTIASDCDTIRAKLEGHLSSSREPHGEHSNDLGKLRAEIGKVAEALESESERSMIASTKQIG